MKRNKLVALGAGIGVAMAITLVISGSLALVPQQAFPEYIIVGVKDRPMTRADVLINGERNGTTGEVITLGSSGWVFISVDLPRARQKNVNVKNTTAIHPMRVEIDCN